MDLDAVADELYGLSPSDFTSVREVRAKGARSEGDRDLAERIHRLRRPTLSAWASNLLVRDQPEEARRLLRLGEALRQTTEELDGDQLRELSAQQRKVTSALARQAADLARQAGQPISEEARREVQETLQAVLADPDAGQEWAEGRLAKPLSAPVGFPALSAPPARVSSAGRPASRRKEAAAPSAAGSATRVSARTADLEAARARRRAQQERLEQARQQATGADRELTEREEGLTAVQDEQRRAEELARHAEERIAGLTRALEEAEGERDRARDAAREAHDRAGEAERSVKEARRHARDAAAQVRRLEGQLRRKGS
ncbi:hypothetical protein [Streptomyces longwoodensis]|uniref:hypothetical protein n=1 Tax=Streptomyces longwoodensis TaxID=68231 RepID=UPI003405FF91